MKRYLCAVGLFSLGVILSTRMAEAMKRSSYIPMHFPKPPAQKLAFDSYKNMFVHVINNLQQTQVENSAHLDTSQTSFLLVKKLYDPESLLSFFACKCFRLSLRVDFIEEQVKVISEGFPNKTTPLVHTSFAEEGLLQPFLFLMRLIIDGYTDITLNLIGPDIIQPMLPPDIKSGDTPVRTRNPGNIIWLFKDALYSIRMLLPSFFQSIEPQIWKGETTLDPYNQDLVDTYKEVMSKELFGKAMLNLQINVFSSADDYLQAIQKNPKLKSHSFDMVDLEIASVFVPASPQTITLKLSREKETLGQLNGLKAAFNDFKNITTMTKAVPNPIIFEATPYGLKKHEGQYSFGPQNYFVYRSRITEENIPFLSTR